MQYKQYYYYYYYIQYILLSSLVLYIKKLLKIHKNLNKIIIVVNLATSPWHPHNITHFYFSICFIILSGATGWCKRSQVFVPWPSALWTGLSAKASPVRGQRRLDTRMAVCVIHESTLLSGQLFSIQIPDVVQSVLHSLSWLLAIDHKKGTRVLNKHRGFML